MKKRYAVNGPNVIMIDRIRNLIDCILVEETLAKSMRRKIKRIDKRLIKIEKNISK